jgi:conjugative transfer signal peptidase TraF
MRGLSSKGTRSVVLLTVGSFIATCVLGHAGLRFNATPSVPTGLYWISSDPRAEFVEFCPPQPFGTLSVERGYRMRSREGCPDGGIPLLKPVVAKTGDVVQVSPAGILVNGVRVANTARRLKDSLGRQLNSWPTGSYKVSPGTVWVASSYNSGSFDSRYFGPITESAIKHRLRPIWTE